MKKSVKKEISKPGTKKADRVFIITHAVISLIIIIFSFMYLKGLISEEILENIAIIYLIGTVLIGSFFWIISKDIFISFVIASVFLVALLNNSMNLGFALVIIALGSHILNLIYLKIKRYYPEPGMEQEKEMTFASPSCQDSSINKTEKIILFISSLGPFIGPSIFLFFLAFLFLYFKKGPLFITLSILCLIGGIALIINLIRVLKKGEMTLGYLNNYRGMYFSKFKFGRCPQCKSDSLYMTTTASSKPMLICKACNYAEAKMWTEIFEMKKKFKKLKKGKKKS